MKKLALITVPLVLILLGATSYLNLAIAPTEATMGDVQRIFYYHVASGWVGMFCFFLNFVASIWYLWKRSPRADALAAASAEVGVVFCAMLLLLGMLWARPVWGIWWTWDARLTTTLILWLIYVSYLVLRRFSASGQTQVLSAAFAVFGFADVPIVYFSIQWWRTQHPSPVLTTGGLGPGMAQPLLLMTLAFALLGTALLLVRLQQESMTREIDSLRRQAHAL